MLQAAEKPKIRAVTAFITVDRNAWRQQVQDAAQRLRQAKAAFEAGGYPVEDLRLATQPFPLYLKGLKDDAAVQFLQDFDTFATAQGLNPAVGPAMLSVADSTHWADVLASALARSKRLHGTVMVASEDGVHWGAVRAAARLVHRLAGESPGSAANFQFAAIAMLPPDGPFFPGAYHWGATARFGVAWEAANVVAEAFAGSGGDAITAARKLEVALIPHANAIEQIARRLEGTLGWQYAGMDVSPAPNRDISIGRAIENFTGAAFGSSGTLTATSVITSVLRRLTVRRTGYSGMMIPVLEDSVLAQRWAEGKVTVDTMLAYSAICGTGLDTIPLPGDVSEAQLARMIGDMATMSYRLNKPLTARLMPVKGKKPGDRTEFQGAMLVNTTLQPLP